MTGATVLTIGGAKGGAGKTAMAINVASALRSVGFSVALVDADLGTTNVADVLELDVETSIHEVLAGEADVQSAITTAETGLDVLSGGDSIAYLAEADPAELRSVIDTLSSAYDTVVVDTGTGLSHEVLVPFGLADGVALVSTPEDTSIVDTRKTAEVVEKVDGTLLGVVVNRVTEATDLDRVREKIDLPLLTLLPEDPRASKTEPVVMNAAATDLAEAYRQLATTLHRQIGDSD
ncbi:MinD/ParA family ATP-binding protein [Halapricum desulfuricans]|uniref:FleN family ATPase involved in flagellar biosynthesis n=1 Tax=Halapricum desulfuricans TaxID=2841257 RepID=A0A897N275_9EURY|nr:P-loop NTPase [Halapricum desulfuricans]QSG05199.1 FleN family ATPase involved in flagellar biosynthesis [Halapricum desulfuricans]